MPQTIIVSNRLPVSVKRVNGKLEYYPSSGGLATGLSSFVNNPSGLWIGWPGIASDDLSEEDKIAIVDRLAIQNCYPVFLTQRQVEEYYNGYSNSVLWPYLHELPIYAKETESMWRAYREVNRLFAETTTMLAQEKCRIWVHDYQLLLVPQMLREHRPEVDIGFFMHIPYPSASNALKLPTAKRLIKGLLGSNLIGFHTNNYAQNFLEACQLTGVGAVVADKVISEERETEVTAFPLGIDYTKYSGAANSPKVKKEYRKLSQKYGKRKVILTVDRLDPTKGFVERLNAYRNFLEANPKWHKKVVMSMLAVPSRTDIKAYSDLKEQVEELVEVINKKFGVAGWRPIDYHYTSVPFERLSALYQIADVAFVSPIKDGMNLVAKEYIASNYGKSGVLILSRTAGAAQELKDAVLVNPKQPVELTKALKKALTMPKEELQKRLDTMHKHLSTHTVQSWTKSFLKDLNRAGKRSLHFTRNLTDKRMETIVGDFTAAKKRLIVLDYDGVLVPFSSKPNQARPSAQLKRILTNLGSDRNTDIAIISGRSEKDLEKWLGDLPVALAAEHGAAIRSGPSTKWRSIINKDTAWKSSIKPILDKYAAQASGSFVEEKKYSLVWHYRNTSSYFAQKYSVIIKRNLGGIAKKMGLKIHAGHKILEIKPALINKGVATKFFLSKSHDFILAIGDDYTDEDIFKALPKDSYTIHVGPEATNANWRVKNSDKALEILFKLVN